MSELQQHRPLIPGLPNFRDLGGYATADGRRVRTGALYRSEALNLTGPEDEAALSALGIRTVCDLRGGRERATHPTLWPAGHRPDMLHLDVGLDLRAGAAELVAILVADPTGPGARRMLMASYAGMPRAFAPVLSRFLAAALGPGLPLLFHCTAGKDRTGFLSAVLLDVLGVPRETIRQDYVLTSMRSDLDRMKAQASLYVQALTGRTEHEAELLDAMCGTDIVYIDAALDAMAQGWGSSAGYLEAVGGLDAAGRARLDALLLE